MWMAYYGMAIFFLKYLVLDLEILKLRGKMHQLYTEIPAPQQQVLWQWDLKISWELAMY